MVPTTPIRAADEKSASESEKKVDKASGKEDKQDDGDKKSD
jgi:hypothetical protein